MMPKPLRRLFKSQINSGMRVLQGMMDGIAPKKILDWAKVQAIKLISVAKVKILAFIKDKTSGAPQAAAGAREDGRKKNLNQQIQLGVDISDESQGDVDMLASA